MGVLNAEGKIPCTDAPYSTGSGTSLTLQRLTDRSNRTRERHSSNWPCKLASGEPANREACMISLWQSQTSRGGVENKFQGGSTRGERRKKNSTDGTGDVV